MKKCCAMMSFVIILCLLIYAAGNILRPTNTDIAISSINTFHSLPENSLDVIAYGSSHCFRSFNTAVLRDEYGISIYNYAASWQKLNTTLLFIKDSLRTQKPKVILVEMVYIDYVKEDSDVDGEIYYTRSIPWSESKKQYLRQVFGPFRDNYERYISYFIPFVMDHSNWENIGKDNFVLNSNSIDFEETCGYGPIETITPIEITYNKEQEKELEEKSRQILDEIVQICKDQDIELVLFTTPYEGEYYYSNALEQYAAENNCYYLNYFDYLDECGIDPDTDFYDTGHLNVSGATKVARFMGDFMVANGIMP